MRQQTIKNEKLVYESIKLKKKKRIVQTRRQPLFTRKRAGGILGLAAGIIIIIVIINHRYHHSQILSHHDKSNITLEIVILDLAAGTAVIASVVGGRRSLVGFSFFITIENSGTKGMRGNICG